MFTFCTTLNANAYLGIDAGFPRTLAQAEQLQKLHPISVVLNLVVPTSVILDRVQSRWVHLPSGRVYNIGFNDPRVPVRVTQSMSSTITRFQLVGSKENSASSSFLIATFAQHVQGDAILQLNLDKMLTSFLQNLRHADCTKLQMLLHNNNVCKNELEIEIESKTIKTISKLAF